MLQREDQRLDAVKYSRSHGRPPQAGAGMGQWLSLRSASALKERSATGAAAGWAAAGWAAAAFIWAALSGMYSNTRTTRFTPLVEAATRLASSASVWVTSPIR